MNYKMLVEASVLAGEIMLVSGAEICRVEDTISRMLKKSHLEIAEVIVFSTGIFVTLNDPAIEAITVSKRVSKRATNLNRIYLVNNVSRGLCNDELTLEEAYSSLEEISTALQYRPWLKKVGIMGVALFFAILLGGNLKDCVGAIIVGVVLAFAMELLSRLKLNDFCQNAAASFSVAVTALLLHGLLLKNLNTDLVIISAIMPLVPGVIFTTGIRDTLNGDYSSGVARLMEAVVIALAVAVGVGAGMMAVGSFVGGEILW